MPARNEDRERSPAPLDAGPLGSALPTTTRSHGPADTELTVVQGIRTVAGVMPHVLVPVEFRVFIPQADSRYVAPRIRYLCHRLLTTLTPISPFPGGRGTAQCFPPYPSLIREPRATGWSSAPSPGSDKTGGAPRVARTSPNCGHLRDPRLHRACPQAACQGVAREPKNHRLAIHDEQASQMGW